MALCTELLRRCFCVNQRPTYSHEVVCTQLASKLTQAGGAALLDKSVSDATKRLALRQQQQQQQQPHSQSRVLGQTNDDPSVMYALQASNAALREEVLRLRRGSSRPSQLEDALSRQVDALAEASRRAALSKEIDGERLEQARQELQRLQDELHAEKVSGC